MAFKFEIIDTALVITDTGTGVIEEEYPKRDCYFNNKKLVKYGIVEIYDTNSVNEWASTLFEADISECEDAGGTPFTAATLRDFARLNLAFSSGGGTGTGWDGQVEFRADLPTTLSSPAIGSIYLVEKKTTILFGAYTTYQSGLYIKDTDTGSLNDWRRLNVKVNFTDSEFAVVNAADQSKRAQFDLSLYTTATTRTITWPDKNITVAGIGDIITPPVDSVNTKTGAVVIDPDDLNDTTTTNKFTTAGDISKLGGIAPGAEVNVQSDWNAVAGDAFIQNKPTDVTDLSAHTADELNGVSAANSTALGNLSGTNTGDETTGSIQSKRPLKTVGGTSLEGAGDIPISGGGDVSSAANIDDNSLVRGDGGAKGVQQAPQWTIDDLGLMMAMMSKSGYALHVDNTLGTGWRSRCLVFRR